MPSSAKVRNQVSAVLGSSTEKTERIALPATARERELLYEASRVYEASRASGTTRPRDLPAA